MSAILHNTGGSGDENGRCNDSDGNVSVPGFQKFCQPDRPEFIGLGKFIAPRIDRADDRALVCRVMAGQTPEDIAQALNVGAADLTVRLVQLRTGPLGRVRPAAGERGSRPFEDVALKRSAVRVAERQPPILSLAAVVLGDDLQRLGDRVYLAGQETPLPKIVTLAREKGMRIRYPRLDPMRGALNGGPSRADRRNRRPAGPWEVPQ